MHHEGQSLKFWTKTVIGITLLTFFAVFINIIYTYLRAQFVCIFESIWCDLTKANGVQKPFRAVMLSRTRANCSLRRAQSSKVKVVTRRQAHSTKLNCPTGSNRLLWIRWYSSRFSGTPAGSYLCMESCSPPNMSCLGIRVAIEWLPRPHKNTPTEFYMKKKPHKAQNIAV